MHGFPYAPFIVKIATKYHPALHGDTMSAEDVIGACKASCARLQVVISAWSQHYHQEPRHHHRTTPNHTRTYFDRSGRCIFPPITLAASGAPAQVDRVDLYYVHRLHATVPVEEQARAMQACREAGLCTFVGVSEFSPANLRAFHAICPVTAVQQEW